MKQRLIVIFACVTLLVSGVACAKNYVLVLSPMQSHEALHQQSAATLRFIAEHVKPGESALIVDGLHLKTIAQFEVKNNKAYDHPKAKMQLNRKAVIALRQFADNPVKVAEHGIAGVVQIPQLLQFLGQNYGSFRDTDIIILASPIYVDARDPNWGMVNNQYPGDGHFNAAPQDSPFSLQGRGTLLTVRVFIGRILIPAGSAAKAIASTLHGSGLYWQKATAQSFQLSPAIRQRCGNVPLPGRKLRRMIMNVKKSTKLKLSSS